MGKHHSTSLAGSAVIPKERLWRRR